MPITHYTSPITFTSAPIPARHGASERCHRYIDHHLNLSSPSQCNEHIHHPVPSSGRRHGPLCKSLIINGNLQRAWNRGLFLVEIPRPKIQISDFQLITKSSVAPSRPHQDATREPLTARQNDITSKAGPS